ncbi:MAG: ATP-binding protein [Bacteroidales bacterium]
MNIHSSWGMALLLAFLAAMIASVCVSLSFFIPDTSQFWYMLVTFAIVFIIVLLIGYSLLNKFVVEKITPVYKTIRGTSQQDSAKNGKLTGTGMLAEVSKEVINWAVNRNREIAQLKQMEKYRREFLGNVSHELKTPIFNIQGYVLTLLDGGLEDPAVNRLYLEKTEKSINRMISIVEDLEAISRLESGEMELEFEVFNIIPLVEEVFDLQEVRAKSQGIRLEFARKYDRPIKVYADRKRILEVVNNLVINSINYGNPDGRTIVTFSDLGDDLLVEVKDTGIGVLEKDINRIFERFYRVDKSRSRDFGGTGLGLSIVKHILEAHGCRIMVQSTPGAGSTFSFQLKKA